MFTAEAQSPQRKAEKTLGWSPFLKRSKLLADKQFGVIPLLRFVSSARWRAHSSARRLVETEQSDPTDRRARDQLSLHFWRGKSPDDTFLTTIRRLDQGTVTGAAQPLPIRGPPAEVLP